MPEVYGMCWTIKSNSQAWYNNYGFKKLVLDQEESHMCAPRENYRLFLEISSDTF